MQKDLVKSWEDILQIRWRRGWETPTRRTTRSLQKRRPLILECDVWTRSRRDWHKWFLWNIERRALWLLSQAGKWLGRRRLSNLSSTVSQRIRRHRVLWLGHVWWLQQKVWYVENRIRRCYNKIISKFRLVQISRSKMMQCS